jgi:hypothetical protein
VGTQNKIFGKNSYLSYMKKIIRLTESQLIKIVENEISYERKKFMINKFIDMSISEKTPDEYEAEDFNDYKSEIQWSTLGLYEDLFGEMKDVEEFFSIISEPEFVKKIKKGYSNYMEQ